MLETKYKIFTNAESLCNELSHHPEYQVVQVTDAIKSFKNPQMINGKFVDCEHCYTLFYKVEGDEENEMIEVEVTHIYVIAVYDNGQTKFVSNMKFDDENRIYEYDFCYSVDDAEKILKYEEAVNIKKDLTKAYESAANWSGRVRKVDVLEVWDE